MCLTRFSHATGLLGNAVEDASPASSDSCDSSLAGGVIVFVGICFAVTLDGAALLKTGLESRGSLSRGLYGSASFLYSRLAATLSSFCRWAVALTTPAARPIALRGTGGCGFGCLNPAEVSVTAKFAACCIAISGDFCGFAGGWLGYSRMYAMGWASPACATVRGAEGFLSKIGCVRAGGVEIGD
jgi:hypothetical protein